MSDSRRLAVLSAIMTSPSRVFFNILLTLYRLEHRLTRRVCPGRTLFEGLIMGREGPEAVTEVSVLTAEPGCAAASCRGGDHLLRAYIGPRLGGPMVHRADYRGPDGPSSRLFGTKTPREPGSSTSVLDSMPQY